MSNEEYVSTEKLTGLILFKALVDIEHACKHCDSCQRRPHYEPCSTHQKVGYDKHCEFMHRGCSGKLKFWHTCEEHAQPDIVGAV